MKRFISFVATGLLAAGMAHADTGGATTGVLNSRGDLDLNGSFVYAVTMNAAAAGVALNDATFTSGLYGATSGFNINFEYYYANWHPTTGDGSDSELNAVMRAIGANANGNTNGGIENPLTFSMGGLVIGQTYKVQMLFGENCCNRGFDIKQDGQLIADDFSPYALSGGYAAGSAFLSNTFTATSSTVSFALGGFAPNPDNNPILNAVTLEAVTAVPEPETYAMFLAGLAALGFMARRRRNV